jgi:putative DNA primase/helicase
MTNKPSSSDQIPPVLKSLPQWVLWRLEKRADKQTKIPYNAKRPKQCAASTDPATWATFDVLPAQVFGQANSPLS